MTSNKQSFFIAVFNLYSVGKFNYLGQVSHGRTKY